MDLASNVTSPRCSEILEGKEWLSFVAMIPLRAI